MCVEAAHKQVVLVDVNFEGFGEGVMPVGHGREAAETEHTLFEARV